MDHTQSSAWFKRALQVIPGGVNSPVRAFKSVGQDPIFIERAQGARLYDVDGNVYRDFIGSWGPMILGHAPELLSNSIEEAFGRGTSYGLPTLLEVEMAELLRDAYPAAEMSRMVSSGTEATMSAIRLARGYTGRDKFIKFEGCYHGHSDALLVQSGSGTLTYQVPTSPGVPAATVSDTLVCTYNDFESVRKTIQRYPRQIAAVIIEPVAGNMGVLPPDREFLKNLRQITQEEGIVLIFDEVITGFRLAYGGASAYLGIEPDLVTFGKIIGGGLPVGAYGGRRQIMEKVSPAGPIYQAGTLSGNPLAMHLGLTVLRHLRKHQEIYQQLTEKATRIASALGTLAREKDLKVYVSREGCMCCLFFTPQEPSSYERILQADTARYAEFFTQMVARGYLLPPAQFEALFLSAAHTDADIEDFIQDASEVLLALG